MSLTTKELHALSNVVAYMLEGEEDHYLNCDQDVQPFHVYRDVVILDRLRKKEEKQKTDDQTIHPNLPENS